MKRKNSDEFDSSDDERFLKRPNMENALSECEKKIVNKSLSMIEKASSSDWNYERDEDRMILHTYSMIDDNLYEIIVEVSYVEEETECRVRYRPDNGRYSILFYKWDNDIMSNEIHFVKYEQEKFLLFFSKTIEHRFSLDCIDHLFCYFREARSHLQDLNSR